MAFVSEVKVYAAFVCLPFEFLQLLGLMRIELRRGRALGTFSYTSISRANADKKALNVLSEASLPVACRQASLAFLTLCLTLICVNPFLYLPATSRIIPIFEPNNQNEKTV